jgi:hypothetical protein
VIIDVRAVSKTAAGGGPFPVANPKFVTDVLPGDVVTFEIFATVTGTNGVDDEGLQGINGAIRSSTGGYRGHLQGQLVAPFNGLSSSVGTTIDVDSDGDLDVSGPNPELAGGYWNPRNVTGYSTDGTRVGEGETFLIGRATFTPDPAAFQWGETTEINFFQHRTSTGGNSIAFGTFLIDNNAGGPRNPTNTPISSAGGVIIDTGALPEPGGVALATIGALGLLARRKKNAG